MYSQSLTNSDAKIQQIFDKCKLFVIFYRNHLTIVVIYCVNVIVRIVIDGNIDRFISTKINNIIEPLKILFEFGNDAVFEFCAFVVLAEH